MRLERIRLHNVGTHKDLDVDFSSQGDAKLVAISGVNGAGKSTLLELAMPGTLYRGTPTRGSLLSLATARDSWLETDITVGGERYIIKHLLDAASKKSEASVTRGDGTPVLDGSKVSEFDAWVSRAVVDRDVLLASVFRAQGTEGLAQAKPAERKTILLRALGIDKLEKLAQIARDNVKSASGEVAKLESRLDELGPDESESAKLRVESAQAELENMRANLAEAEAELESARAKQAEVAAAIASIESETARYDEAQARIAKLNRDKSALETRISAEAAKLEKCEGLDSGAVEIQRKNVLEQLKVSEDELTTLLDDETALRDELNEAKAALQLASGNAQLVVSQITALAHSAQAFDADADNKLAAAVDVVRALEAKIEELEAAPQASDDRVGHLRDGLARVTDATTLDEAKDEAAACLAEDDSALSFVDERPAALKTAWRELAQAKLDVSSAQRAVEDSKKALEAAEELEAKRIEQKRSIELETEAKAQVASASGKLQAVSADVAAAKTAVNTLRDETDNLRKQLDTASEAMSIRAVLIECRDQISRIDADIDAATDSVPALPPAPPLPVNIDAFDARVKAARAELSRVESTLAVAQAAVEKESEIATRRGTVKASLEEMREELGDWKCLARDLGKDGIQAAEIDAAGPELTALCNDLLHECHGTRWAIRIDTQRLSSDGKKQLEGLEIVVIDTENGREDGIETYSGGERVVLGEAVSLALTTLACRRLGLDAPTLIRDESGAALDATNAQAYIAMLRRAADIVGASRVLLVSHSAEVRELCDSVIEIGRGAA